MVLSEIPHGGTGILTRAWGPSGAKMAPMNTTHAPNRCAPRAMRIAQVKFMALPMEDMDAVTPAEAVVPLRSGSNPAQGLFTALRAYLIRVIGRLEAARP